MKPIDDFIVDLCNRHLKPPVEEIYGIRDWFIEKGLKTDAFKATGKTESTSLESDFYFLYLLVKHYKVRTVVEVGTWFGASAAVMALAGANVYTCDQHKVYLKNNRFSDRIKYYNCRSERFFERLRKKEVQADMVFVDGRVRRGDDKQIVRLMDKGAIFASHDWHLDKGRNNIKLMSKRLKGYQALVPKTDKSGTVVDGLQINSSVAVVVPE